MVVVFSSFFVPDLGMLVYLYGNKMGSVGYNFCHHKGLAIATHSFLPASFNRILGFGLKYKEGTLILARYENKNDKVLECNKYYSNPF